MTAHKEVPGISAERRREAEERVLRIRQALRDSYELSALLPPEPRRPSTFTYFIQVEDPALDRLGPGGPIKIGCAANPAARLLQLQTSSPYELRLMGYVPGGEKLERELHKKYADLRMRGEWFRATEDLECDLYMRIYGYEEDCLG